MLLSRSADSSVRPEGGRAFLRTGTRFPPPHLTRHQPTVGANSSLLPAVDRSRDSGGPAMSRGTGPRGQAPSRSRLCARATVGLPRKRSGRSFGSHAPGSFRDGRSRWMSVPGPRERPKPWKTPSAISRADRKGTTRTNSRPGGPRRRTRRSASPVRRPRGCSPGRSATGWPWLRGERNPPASDRQPRTSRPSAHRAGAAYAASTTAGPSTTSSVADPPGRRNTR